jgi:hypothetical protein
MFTLLIPDNTGNYFLKSELLTKVSLQRRICFVFCKHCARLKGHWEPPLVMSYMLCNKISLVLSQFQFIIWRTIFQMIRPCVHTLIHKYSRGHSIFKEIFIYLNSCWFAISHLLFPDPAVIYLGHEIARDDFRPEKIKLRVRSILME